MSEIRILPILPPTKPLDTPFLSAIKEIEDENGRQIQAQIRLLKGLELPLSQDEKEQIVYHQRMIVQSVFCELLEAVCKQKPTQDEQAEGKNKEV